MIRIKRILASLLVCVMVVGILAGCGSTSDDKIITNQPNFKHFLAFFHCFFIDFLYISVYYFTVSNILVSF